MGVMVGRGARLGLLWVAGLVLWGARAAAVEPGDTITTDTTLTADLVDHAFTGTVLTIGADNITLDGGGHVIDAPSAGAVIFCGNHTGVTIKNVSASGSWRIDHMP